MSNDNSRVACASCGRGITEGCSCAAARATLDSMRKGAPLVLDAEKFERALVEGNTSRKRERLTRMGLLVFAHAFAASDPMHLAGRPGAIARRECRYCNATAITGREYVAVPHKPECLWRYAKALVRALGVDVQALQNSIPNT